MFDRKVTMSTRKKPRNVVPRLVRRIWRSFYTVITALVNSVLRGLMVQKRRRSRQSQAGFVLPTVVMVLLVVALLTTAIVIRSFDRAKNASNIRVDQAVLNAATPALDRARAKIERLFSPEENRLTSNPPAEGSNFDEPGTISAVLSTDQYTFNDETPLKVVDLQDTTGGGIGKNDQIKTAWKFPVDTDNNGKFDSFTLYGIYFRNPATNEDRPRSPIEARAIPQVTGQSDTCAVASAGGSSQELQGWYETDGQLKKAFFTYVANVPITTLGTLDPNKYEPYKGNRSFSALEMQQDQGRIALDNNAVWYDDDLVVSNVPIFRLNGRIHTNSNLMVANNGTVADDSIVFYQVSSVYSCYYKPENAKIIVGGHVVAGDITGDTNGNTTDSTNNLVQVHLYRPQDPNAAPQIPQVLNVNTNNKTTTLDPAQIATNSSAYEARLNLLVNAALHVFDAAYPDTKDLTALEATANTVNAVASFPQDVKSKFESKYDQDNPSSGPNILKQVLTTYFAERLRRPSYQEVPLTGDPSDVLKRTPGAGVALTIDTVFAAGGITPPIEWMRYNTANPTDLPTKASNQGAGIELEATDPATAGTGRNEIESRIGDRIKVGNSLPRRWLKADNTTYASPGEEQKLGVNWTGGSTERVRKGLVEQLDDLGDTSRGGYWERAAALSGQEFESPATRELAGGLRVITGAGVYIDGVDPASGGTGKRGDKSFLPEPPAKNGLELKQMAASDPYGIKLPPEVQSETNVNTLKEYRVVWPDTMPMFEWKDNIINNQYDFPASPNPPEIRRGDLQMRATVVYHYASSEGTQQAPIACIATFYDPTDPDRAQNFDSLSRRNPDQKTTTFGASINGINYPASYASTAARSSALGNIKLLRQANMLFPDGRWVNKPLRDAVVKLRDKGINALNLADIAAIDAANCALKILENPASVDSSGLVPDFAIQEQAFLDARQIKALHKRDTESKVNPATGVADRLRDVAGNYVTRETKREYITNPDKLKIAELGELNLPITGVANYPFYSLPIEQRQPLEIRVTQIDLDQLRQKPVPNKDEYLLPNSGIIYASRDDALPDISNFNPKTGGDKGSSATDFLLDPTRRPNGILLVKGANLARTTTYRTAEKGLILATDLPVYIKSQSISSTQGGFNLHLRPGATDIDDTTVREEFNNRLDDDYGDFYTRRANADGSGFDPNFACRTGQNTRCTEGDQWRAARILSDAVTLLSSNFRFGYRNEGDFDLNNNAGNLAVESRLKNGFWWNGFGTNGEWVDTATTTGLPKDFDAAKANRQGSTYVTNGVTPIQRRGNFPEYKMEICRKLPVAACGPGDWTQTGAGTTASTSATLQGDSLRYVDPGDRRYPRRVAFKRNSVGEIEMPECTTSNNAFTPDVNCKAIPIVVDGATNIDVVYDGMTAYTGSTATLPATASQNNSLWFWTTGANTNPSVDPINYGNTNKLYYAPYDPEEVSERQLLLPGLPDFPKQMLDALNIPGFTLNLNSTSTTNLNSAPSDYSVFSFNSNSGTCSLSRDYKPTQANLVLCANDPETTTNQAAIQSEIQKLWSMLLTFNQSIDGVVYIDKIDTPNAMPFNPLNPLPRGDYRPGYKTTVTLKAYAKVNIYSLPQVVANLNEEFLSGLEIIFDANNRIDNPIFVIRPYDYQQNLANKTPLIFGNYVKVIPKGVDPNNIFWVPSKFVQIRVHNDANDHELAGNFIGGDPAGESLLAFTNNQGNPPAPPPTKPILNGGRFLGFVPPLPDTLPAGAMRAMTTTAEPLLIPVLNLHSPEGTPGGTQFDGEIQQSWVQNVPATLTENFNAVFIMGDSPSRPFTATTGMRSEDRGERGGGLANFPRFLESWRITGTSNSVPTKIRGSFIQFKKSIFATAPFEVIDDPQSDTSLFFDSASGTRPAYMLNYNTASTRPYIYRGGGQLQKAPYYMPPRRLWGYDVGLLKQTPDLFSRRFSTPSAGTPNEYFREVGRDDPWIETLLCAADATPPATAGQPYTYTTWAISDARQRPGKCQDPTPPSAQYSDP
jgi:type II secretory pathway pseudopilin PulG